MAYLWFLPIWILVGIDMWAIGRNRKFMDKFWWMVLIIILPLIGFIMYLVVGRKYLKSSPVATTNTAPPNGQAAPTQPNQVAQPEPITPAQTSIVGQSYSTLQDKGLVNKESTAKKVSKVTGILLILTAVGGGLFIIVIIVGVIMFFNQPPQSSSSGSKGAM